MSQSCLILCTLRTQFPCAWTKLYKGCARTSSTNFASDLSVGCSFAADTSIYSVLKFLRTATTPQIFSSLQRQKQQRSSAYHICHCTSHQTFLQTLLVTVGNLMYGTNLGVCISSKGLIHSWSEHSCLALGRVWLMLRERADQLPKWQCVVSASVYHWNLSRKYVYLVSQVDYLGLQVWFII